LAAPSSDCRRRAFRALLVAAFLLAACAQPQPAYDPVGNLLGLIDQRLALAGDVALSKWNSDAPVEDLARENEIVAAIGAETPRYGLEPALARDFFRAQIEASKIAQNARLAEWRAEKRPKFPNAPDLQRDIRPRLDRLTPQLLEALARALPALKTPGAMERLAIFAAVDTAQAAAVAPLRRDATRNY
jgi:chorismate mutase